MRVQSYSLAMGRLFLSAGSASLKRVVQADFKPRRILVSAADVKVAWWAVFVRRALSWLRLPWPFRQWDDDEDRNRWQVRLVRPALNFYFWASHRAQMDALRGVYLRDVRIGGLSSMITSPPASIPLATLALGSLVVLDLPVVRAQHEIELVFGGVGGPIDVHVIGYADEQEVAS